MWYLRRERWANHWTRMRQGLTRRIYIHAPPSSLNLGPTEPYFPGGKTAGAWICPLVTISCQVKNERRCTSTFLICLGECVETTLVFALAPTDLLKPDLSIIRLWSHPPQMPASKFYHPHSTVIILLPVALCLHTNLTTCPHPLYTHFLLISSCM